MNEQTAEQQPLVVVPEAEGVAALSTAGVRAVVVAPDADVPAEARGASVLVVGPAESAAEVEAALAQVAQLPDLKLLVSLGQGSEQWGDLPMSVSIATARGAHGGSTAEWVVAAVLAQLRLLPEHLEAQREHRWGGRQARTLMRSEVLVLGAGDLGENVRARLLPFGASVTVAARSARDGVVSMEAARELLGSTDVLVVVLPLTDATRHVVDAELLAALPDGALVVNAGRGPLVDTSALLAELQSGRLLAALDVTDPEPLPADHPLWDAPGLLLTPHVAGNTEGAGERAWTQVAEQVSAYARGERPPNLVR
ncbi:phosphoglycerate dehydrogenase [Streptomyces sp. NP160]|uniref:NAD(P)-dependent oxidoreductase n=1 Tax=Streptomyces sp. NP160 TaxID=2586637 RepID=UPI00111A2CF0|nr:NAD(P)-dependent oxidoreductase [Streptomyces sp. NP160]TNM68533.1 phosphoglycerate dehydrogenase [Streptomyces sp. NP160]